MQAALASAPEVVLHIGSTAWLSYLAVSALASASPGPAVLLAVTNATLYGPRRALIGICGNICALFTLAMVSAAGLGAVILASDALFFAVKICGALYLAYLGLRLWRSADAGLPTGAMPRASSRRRLFVQAWWVGMSNPKALAFFSALFPQFIDPAAPLLPQCLLLALTSMCTSAIFLTGFALLADRSRRWMSAGRAQRVFRRASGATFIGLGALLASASR